MKLSTSGVSGKDLLNPEVKVLLGESNFMNKQSNAYSNSDLVIAQALSALIYAPNWPKTRNILEEQQGILLSDRALELLSFTIVQLYLQGDLEDAKNLAHYEELLAHARVFGIALAWKKFIPL
jgi:hypothetical protein